VLGHHHREGVGFARLPIVELLRTHPKALVLGTLFVTCPYTAKTVLNSFGPVYAVELGFNRSTVLTVTSATALTSRTARVCNNSEFNSPLGHSNVAHLRRTTYQCQNPLEHAHVAATCPRRWSS
jgi:hypothetical protein